MKSKKSKFPVKIVSFMVCLMLMAVIPATRDHRLFGIDLSGGDGKVEAMTVLPDGTTVVNTTEIGKDIIGYGGPTPLEIYIVDGRISKIRFLDNNESPEFFGEVRNGSLPDKYIGLTPSEAAALKPDAVSGATFSSKAVIANVEAGVGYALSHGEGEVRTHTSHDLGWKFAVTLFIILCGGIIPLFLRSKAYRYVQLALNVVVLGFWGGTFICYTQMVSWLGFGPGNFLVALPLILMLVTAFVYPWFGKPNHYCNWLCPYGSIQELAGRAVPWKVRMSQKTVRILTVFRNALWFVLMWLLWTGLWFDWMDYEAFAAFFILDAGPVVLGIAGGFLLLSFIVNRPYCRFLCPTGTLFKLSEKGE